MTLRLAALDELNARPLWFSLRGAADVELVPETRQGATRMLEGDRVDLGIVSVVKAAEAGWHRAPGVGIASFGPLDSVLLLANDQPHEASVVYAATESRTSVMLMQALLRRRRRAPPVVTLPAADACQRAMREPGAAAMLIGDDAMKARGGFRHVWDLPAAWTELTGLPMVFGVWASRRSLSPTTAERLVEAAAQGERSRAEIAALAARDGWILAADAEAYLRQLHYRLGPEDELAIRLLLTVLRMYGLIELPTHVATFAANDAQLAMWPTA